MLGAVVCVLGMILAADGHWLDNKHDSQPWVSTSWEYTRDVVVRMDVQRVEAYRKNMEFLYLVRKKCKPRAATLVGPEVCPPEKIYRWYTMKNDVRKKYEKEVLELEGKCEAIEELIKKIKTLKECNDKFFHGKMKATMTIAFTTKPPEAVVIVTDMPKTFEDMPEMMKLLTVLFGTIPVAAFLIATCLLLKKLGVRRKFAYVEKDALVYKKKPKKAEGTEEGAEEGAEADVEAGTKVAGTKIDIKDMKLQLMDVGKKLTVAAKEVFKKKTEAGTKA